MEVKGQYAELKLAHPAQEPPSEENVLQAEAAREAVRQRAAAIEDAVLGQRLRVLSWPAGACTLTLRCGAPRLRTHTFTGVDTSANGIGLFRSAIASGECVALLPPPAFSRRRKTETTQGRAMARVAGARLRCQCGHRGFSGGHSEAAAGSGFEGRSRCSGRRCGGGWSWRCLPCRAGG